MKILYVGCFVDPCQTDLIERKFKAAITVSATTFQRAFLAGFQKYNTKPEIINAPDIGSWPQRCKGIYIPESESSYYGLNCYNVGFFNVSFFKQWSILLSLKKRIRAWLNKYKDEEIIIVVYSLLYPYLKAAIDLKSDFPNVRICCIVLDLPEYFGDNNSILYRFLGFSSQKIYSIAKEVDSYVLLTEHMKIPLNVRNRPWLLMEGIYSPVQINSIKKQEKTILYTGKLDARFGIRSLVDYFSKLKGKDYRLWICGNGLDRDYVVKKSKEDSRIIYYGQVNQNFVFEKQREASLLINPRKPEGEYTKYSFPSKTMEYLASGTPTLMYYLPGMPKEYEDKIVFFKDSSEETFLSVLEEWLNKPQEELNAFGKKASDFIINNKTSDMQIARFLDFIRKNYDK